MTFRIAGVRTQKFGPLEEQIVWLEPGANAVYGLNGSGKSYFLEQIAQLAAGTTAMVGGLILKWDDSPNTRGPGIVIEFAPTPNYFTDADWGPGVSDPGADMPEWMTWAWEFAAPLEPDQNRITFSGLDHEFLLAADRNSRILREVLNHGFLLATPLGTEPASWALWPLVIPSTDTPALVDEFNKFTNLAAQLRDPLEAIRLASDPPDYERPDDELLESLSEECDGIVAESGLRTSILACSLNMPDSGFANLDATFGAGDRSGQPVFVRAVFELQQPTWGVVVEGLSDRATDSAQAQSVDNDTRNALIWLDDHQMRFDAEGNFGGSSQYPEPAHMLHWTSKLSRVATEILPLLLLDAFPLRIDFGDIHGWLSGTHPRWMGVFEYRTGEAAPVPPRLVPLAGLSKAQRRWAEFAIRVSIGVVSDANTRRESLTPLWIVDEPEAALHRSAEEHLAKGLVTLAEKYGATIVAATHSPELLDHPRIHKLYARRPMGYTRIDPLGPVDLSALLELGLRPSDLLRGVRTFILVEGEHEKIIFEEFFGADLTNMRAQLLPARGASKYKDVFDSQFLSKYTDACVLATMDNLNADHLTDTWDQARKLAQQGNIEKASEWLLGELPGTQGVENKFMRDFCIRALKTGQHERVHLFGFSLPDITDYLPIEKFAPKFASWGSAREVWESAREAKDESRTNIPNFKEWLKKTQKSDFSPENVRRAARELLESGTTPADFSLFIRAAKAASDTRNG